MAEWLRPGLWEVLMLSRGIEPGQVLIPKKSIWDVALVSITSAILYGRRKPNCFGVRMAEWLRPGLWEVLMLSRGIVPGQVLTFNKPTGEGWY